MSAVISSIGVAVGAAAGSAAAFGIGALVVGSAVSAGMSIYSGIEGAQAQRDAMGQQERAQANAARQAESQRKQAEQAMNKANRKTPDVSAIMRAAASGQNAGASGTMLTGPTGVDPNALALGKTSLLGG